MFGRKIVRRILRAAYENGRTTGVFMRINYRIIDRLSHVARVQESEIERKIVMEHAGGQRER